MAQSGYTPISLYYSTTAAATPVNTNLVPGELAINITDGKLYYKDNSNVVKLLANANSITGPIGPTGPTGAASNVTGPTGPTGPTGATPTLTPGVGIAIAGSTISTLQVPATTASNTSITPTITTSQYNVTALAVNATILAPAAGVDGQKLLIRIKDNGTSRTLTWTTTSGGFRVEGVALPSATVISTPLYIGCVYNAQDSYWDVLAVS